SQPDARLLPKDPISHRALQALPVVTDVLLRGSFRVDIAHRGRGDSARRYRAQGDQMREQKGYVFHKGKSWFVRYGDDVRQPDGSIKRKLICKKLDVEYGGEYRRKKDVEPFVRDLLAPVNSGLLNPQSTMLVSDFVDKVYIPEYVEKNLRAATLKQYGDIW